MDWVDRPLGPWYRRANEAQNSVYVRLLWREPHKETRGIYHRSEAPTHLKVKLPIHSEADSVDGAISFLHVLGTR